MFNRVLSHGNEMSHAGPRPASPAARAVDLTKTYGTGEVAVRRWTASPSAFERGRFTAVMGPSRIGQVDADALHGGAGRADGGPRLHRRRRRSGGSMTAGLTELRRDRVGFVFQAFNLVPTLTAAENITLPADLAGSRGRPRRGSTSSSASSVSPTASSHRPRELSGGQQQRVACARALVTRPELIFADEPTGNLDSNASAEVLGVPAPGGDEHGQSIVMVTHDPQAAAYADRVVFLADGSGGGRAGLADRRRGAGADEAAGRLTCAGSRVRGLAARKLRLSLTALADRARGDVRHRHAGPGRHAQPHLQHADRHRLPARQLRDPRQGGATAAPTPRSTAPRTAGRCPRRSPRRSAGCPASPTSTARSAGYAQFLARNGDAIGGGGGSTLGFSFDPNRRLSPYRLVQGARPDRR